MDTDMGMGIANLETANSSDLSLLALPKWFSRFAAVAFFVLFSVHPITLAAQSQVEWSLLLNSLTENYQDETSSEGGLESGSRLILGVEPSVRVQSIGARTVTGFRAGAEIVQYPDEAESEFNPSVELFASTSLLNTPFTVAGILSARSADVDSSATGLSFEESVESVATVYSLQLLPALETNIGSDLSLNGQIVLQFDDSQDDRIIRSNRQSLDLSLGTNNVNRGTFGWRIQGIYNRQQLESQEYIAVTEVLAGVDVEIMDGLLFDASVGQEFASGDSNEIASEDEDAQDIFTTLFADENVEGRVIWDVGLSFNPSRRTSVRAVYGQRYYGRRPSVSIEHSTRHSDISLIWTQSVQRASGRTDTPATQLSAPTLINTEFSNALSVFESLTLSYTLRGRLSNLRIEGSWIDRQGSGAAAPGQNFRAAAVFERQLSNRWSWLLNLEDERAFRDDASEDEPRYSRLGVGLRYNSVQTR